MNFYQKIKKFKITLGSQSPRRRELLSGLDIDFTIEPNKDESESFTDDMVQEEVPEFLARHKSDTFHRELLDNEILITADTLVFCNGEIIGKPSDRNDAYNIIKRLSGNTHRVITGVALRSKGCYRSFSAITDVTFNELSDEEIYYYIDKYQPYDKAGAYGVQEWIGYVGINSINGSFYNVMGLPVQRLYTELAKFIEEALIDY